MTKYKKQETVRFNKSIHLGSLTNGIVSYIKKNTLHHFVIQSVWHSFVPHDVFFG